MYINTIGHYLPSRVVPNSYFEPINGLTHDWIESRTGIKERRRAGEEENSHTMAIAAVESCLDRVPYPIEELDLIVGAGYSPYDTVATIAHVVQHRLNLEDVQALYISSACSSLLNAIEVVEGYFAMGKAEKALVVVSEHNTLYANESDPVAGHLWGDGAACLYFSKERVQDSDLEVIDLKTAGAATMGKGIEGVVLRPRDGGIQMPHGRDVFIHACQYMTQVSRDMVQKHGYTIGDLKFFIPHQANRRISVNVAGQLELPEEKLVSNIEHLGNTGSAGCAIGLAQKQTELEKGDLVVLTVFGGGYSYGAMLVKA
ncbi:MAG: ketoacyl-ACP synthase III [Bacteroidota bacterium]